MRDDPQQRTARQVFHHFLNPIVLNPLSGKKEERVLIANEGGKQKILLKKNEVKPCITAYYNKYKGVGSRKLYNSIMKVFVGVTEREIQAYINSQQISQQMSPTFVNKPTIKPVISLAVMDQIQMDLVDMQSSPVVENCKTFLYILVILDVFSRYIFLRALQSKSSKEIASHVLQLFSDIGPPKRVQTDQGTEFKGAVKIVMNAFKVHIIHSRPYHPQSQGKVGIIFTIILIQTNIIILL